MKTTTIIMTIVVGLAIQALGADPAKNPSASASATTTTTTGKNFVQKRISQYLEPATTPQSYKIERVGNISSRPWAATASYSSGLPTFAGDRERYYEPRFNLFWLGSRPD